MAAQPTHRLLEQRGRPLSVRPGPPVEESPELLTHQRVLERPKPIGGADLSRMLVGRFRPILVPLHTRGILEGGDRNTFERGHLACNPVHVLPRVVFGKRSGR